MKKLPSALLESLPPIVFEEIDKLNNRGELCFDDIWEIRLREMRPASVTIGGKNKVLPIKLSKEDMAACIKKLCRGSVYAHEDTMISGYISFGEGIRIGVCGNIAPDYRALRQVTSINIRIPHIVRNISDQALSYCLDGETVKSMLFYSLPGMGKTTLLRDMASKLGDEYNKRVAVIDTRGEIYIPHMFDNTLCDFFSGYPKGSGAEIATRTMGAEVIICDELGDREEAECLLEAQNTGVPIIATAHASNTEQLLSRPQIKKLHNNRLFSGYIGIKRERVNGKISRRFILSYLTWEEAEALCIK